MPQLPHLYNGENKIIYLSNRHDTLARGLRLVSSLGFHAPGTWFGSNGCPSDPSGTARARDSMGLCSKHLTMFQILS